MKVIMVMAFLACLVLALARPQVGHGSVNGPSGRFPMTKNWALPPVDLRKPIIFLPEATPIHEVQESRAVHTKQKKD